MRALVLRHPRYVPLQSNALMDSVAKFSMSVFIRIIETATRIKIVKSANNARGTSA